MDEVTVGFITLFFGSTVMYLSSYRSFNLFKMGLIIVFIGVGNLTKHYIWPAAIYWGSYAISLGLFLTVLADLFINFGPVAFPTLDKNTDEKKEG